MLIHADTCCLMDESRNSIMFHNSLRNYQSNVTMLLFRYLNVSACLDHKHTALKVKQIMVITQKTDTCEVKTLR